MKNILDKIKIFYKNNKSKFIVIFIGLFLIFSGFISWKIYFEKEAIFHQEEKKFTDAVINYYKYKKQLLPKDGSKREVKLQELYDGNRIDDLYIPKTRKLCDTEKSFVRVFMKDNEYVYLTYLKCGKYESNIDSKAPEIILNGDINNNILYNTEFKDLGVKEVKDNKDKLDVKDVKVSGTVNTKEVGTYEIEYTIYDSNYNEGKVVRYVNVLKGLNETIKESISSDGYFKGYQTNNYILFSGMMFRILNVNTDGTIRIITDNPISYVTYGTKDETFDNSNVKLWLNNYFYNSISKESKKYLKENNEWCFDNVTDLTITTSTCQSKTNANVGLLSVSDYNLTFDSKNDSFLNDGLSSMFINRTTDNKVLLLDDGYNEEILTVENDMVYGTKPVLILNNNLVVYAGNGSFENPYRVGDYYYADKGDKLNTRLIGEYVNYFGMNFRISGYDNDKNIKLTSVDQLGDLTSGMYLFGSYGSKALFNPNNEDSIAYLLNNDYLEYIDEKYIVEHEYNIPKINYDYFYTSLNTEKHKAKVSIPASYDLFSATNGSYAFGANYWLLDYLDDKTAYMVNPLNSLVFKVSKRGVYASNGFKIVIYVNKDVKINSGYGTVNRPYIIK